MQIPSSFYGSGASLSSLAALATRNAATTDSGSNGAGFASLLLQQSQAATAPPPAAPSPPPTQSSAPEETPAPTPPSSANSITKKASAAQTPASTHPKAAPPPKAPADDSGTEAAGRTATDRALPQQNPLDADTRALLRSKLRAADSASPAEEGADEPSEVATSDAPGTTEKQKRGTAHGSDGSGIDPTLNPSTSLLPLPVQALAARSGDSGSGREPQGDDGDAAADKPATSFADAAHGANLALAAKLDDAKLEAKAANATATADPAVAMASSSFSALLADHRAAESAGSTRSAAIDSAAPVAAHASAFGTAPTAGTAASTAVDLPTPVNAPDFAQQLGVQVSVLVKDGVQRAELHLNPADMGPVSVAITLDGTQARIEFGAEVAATRHAIETGMPALASALADAGFTLAGGGVSQHAGGSRGDGQGNPQPGAAGDSGRRSASIDATNSATSRVLRRTVSAGGVDLYA